MTEIDRSRQYHFGKAQRLAAVEAGPGWSTYQAAIELRPDVDRAKLEFELSPAGKVYVGQMSWRKQPR